MPWSAILKRYHLRIKFNFELNLIELLEQYNIMAPRGRPKRSSSKYFIIQINDKLIQLLILRCNDIFTGKTSASSARSVRSKQDSDEDSVSGSATSQTEANNPDWLEESNENQSAVTPKPQQQVKAIEKQKTTVSASKKATPKRDLKHGKCASGGGKTGKVAVQRKKGAKGDVPKNLCHSAFLQNIGYMLQGVAAEDLAIIHQQITEVIVKNTREKATKSE